MKLIGRVRRSRFDVVPIRQPRSVDGNVRVMENSTRVLRKTAETTNDFHGASTGTKMYGESTRETLTGGKEQERETVVGAKSNVDDFLPNLP